MAVSLLVQVFADHAAIVKDVTIVGDQRRNLAQRVARNDALVAIDRVRSGAHELDLVAQAELGGGDEALADEG